MLKIKETAVHVLVEGSYLELDKLVNAFAYQPPGFRFAPSYERFLVSHGKEGWDGYLRPFQMQGGLVRAHRGRKVDVLAWAAQEGYQIDVSKLLPSPFKHLNLDDIDPNLIAGEYALDVSQRQCILGWLRNVVAINQVVVSGGKTALSSGAIAFIKQHYPESNVIYITPSERLVRQSTKELRRMLPQFKVGQYGGGLDESDAEIVVCTSAMVYRHLDELAGSGYLKRFMTIIYDECHHSSSDSSVKILENIPAFFRFGCSDTLKEKDPKRWNTIRGLFGPVVNTVKAAPLINVGRIAQPHIYVVDKKEWTGKMQHVSYDPPIGSAAFVLIDGDWTSGVYAGSVYELDDKGKRLTREVKTSVLDAEGKWIIEEQPIIVPGLHKIEIEGVVYNVVSKWCLLQRVYDQAIIRFRERNIEIVKWAKHFSDQKYPTVIVCTRTLHVYILEALLQKEIDPSLIKTLTGEATPAERDEMFAWISATPGGVLVSPLIKEGVSIPALRAGIVADYIADAESAAQVVGRFIRQKKTGVNKAEIVWFRDRQHMTLRRGCNNVLRWLESVEGYRFIDPAPEPSTLVTDQGSEARELELDA